VLLRAILVCLAAPLDGAEKMPLSDLCNRLSTRAPVDRSTSGRAACAALTAGCFPFSPFRRRRVLPCDAGPPCDNPTPARRVLDGTPPASADPYTVLLASRLGGSGHRLWRCHLGVVFSTMREADVRPLTLPVAPRSLPEFVTPDTFEEPGPLPPPPRQGGRLSRSEAPSLDRCSQIDSLARPDWFEGTRHRSRGFATDDPASDALSPLRRSRAVGLDPFIVVRKLFAFGREGPRAACRLLQSIRPASTTTDH
jgi:hypothetical protein